MVGDFRGAPNLGCVCKRASFHFIALLNVHRLLHTSVGLRHDTDKQTQSASIKDKHHDTHCQDILGLCQLVFVVHLTTDATSQQRRALLELSSPMSSDSHGFWR